MSAVLSFLEVTFLIILMVMILSVAITRVGGKQGKRERPLHDWRDADEEGGEE